MRHLDVFINGRKVGVLRLELLVSDEACNQLSKAERSILADCEPLVQVGIEQHFAESRPRSTLDLRHPTRSTIPQKRRSVIEVLAEEEKRAFYLWLASEHLELP